MTGWRGLWVHQAVHDAEVAHFLEGHGFWSDAILAALEAIEKALKALGAMPSLRQQLSGDLSATWHVDEPRVPRTHDVKQILSPNHKRMPTETLRTLLNLKPDRLRLELRYPADDKAASAPFRHADEPAARPVLRLMDEVVGYVRAALAFDDPTLRPRDEAGQPPSG